MNSKIYFDITGITFKKYSNNNSKDHTYRQIIKTIHSSEYQDITFIKWDKYINEYVNISIYKNQYNSYYLNDGIVYEYDFFDIIKYLLYFLIKRTRFGGLLYKIFSLLHLERFSEKILNIKDSIFLELKEYINLKMKVKFTPSSISESDSIIIFNEYFLKSEDYLFNILKAYNNKTNNITIVFGNTNILNCINIDKLSIFSLSVFSKNKLKIISTSLLKMGIVSDILSNTGIHEYKELQYIEPPFDIFKTIIKQSSSNDKNISHIYCDAKKYTFTNLIFLIKLWNNIFSYNSIIVPRLIVSINSNNTLKCIKYYLRKKNIILGNRIMFYINLSTEMESYFYSNSLFTICPGKIDKLLSPIMNSIDYNKICICNNTIDFQFVPYGKIEMLPPLDIHKWSDLIVKLYNNTFEYDISSRSSKSNELFLSELISSHKMNKQSNHMTNKITMYSPVNIVLSDKEWVLEELSLKLKDNLDYVSISNSYSNKSIINYYINYSGFQKKGPHIDIGFFTHVEEFSKPAKKRFIEVAKQMDIAICMSERYRDFLAKEVNKNKITIIMPGVDLEHFIPKLKVGISGRTYHTGRKGEKLVSELINENWIEWYFTGDGWPKPGMNLKYSEMPSFYRSLDVLLVPSFYEGGPMPVLEALACGTKIVSSNVGFVDSFPHIEFTNGDSNSMKEALYSLYKEKLMLRESVLNVTWENWIHRHDNIFRTCLTDFHRSKGNFQ